MKKGLSNKLLKIWILFYFFLIVVFAIFIFVHKKKNIIIAVKQRLKNAAEMSYLILGKDFLINAIKSPSKNSDKLIWKKITEMTNYNLMHKITITGFETIKNNNVYDLIGALRKKKNLKNHIRKIEGDDAYNFNLSKNKPNSAAGVLAIIKSRKNIYWKKYGETSKILYYFYYKHIKLTKNIYCAAIAGIDVTKINFLLFTAVIESTIVLLIFLILALPFIIIITLKFREEKKILKQKNKELDLAKKEADQHREKAETERNNALKLNELNELKDQFFANMSHDFRTPINSILGFNKQIKEEVKNKKVCEITENIKMSAEYMLHFTEDLLDFARMENSEIEIIPEVVNIEKLSYRLAEYYCQKSGKTHKKFEMQNKSDLPIAIESSERRLFQIINNLVGNAFKFTDDYGKIELIFKKSKNNEIVIIVKDNGVGIPDDKLETIFEKFSKLNNKNNGSGAGLGLFITKNIVEKMGGKIFIKSRIDKYTEFKVVLPLVEVKEHCSFDNLQEKFLKRNKDEDATTRQILLRKYIDQIVKASRDIKLLAEKKNKKEIRIILHNLIPPTVFLEFYEFMFYIEKIRDEVIKNTPNYRKVRKFTDIIKMGINELEYPIEVLSVEDKVKIKNSKILVVDDNENNVLIIQAQLAKYSYKADAVYSGAETLDQVEIKKYKVIFIDINMPVMDGRQLLKALKNKNIDALMIAYTAENSQNAEQRLLDEGFDEVFIKPIGESELISILNYVNGIKSDKIIVDPKTIDVESFQKYLHCKRS